MEWWYLKTERKFHKQPGEWNSAQFSNMITITKPWLFKYSRIILITFCYRYDIGQCLLAIQTVILQECCFMEPNSFSHQKTFIYSIFWEENVVWNFNFVFLFQITVPWAINWLVIKVIRMAKGEREWQLLWANLPILWDLLHINLQN